MASHNILPYAGSYCWLFDQSATLFLQEMTDELYRHGSLSKAENNDGKCFYHFPSSCLESFSIDQCSTQQKVRVIRLDQDTLKLVTLVKYTDIPVLWSKLETEGKKKNGMLSLWNFTVLTWEFRKLRLVFSPHYLYVFSSCFLLFSLADISFCKCAAICICMYTSDVQPFQPTVQTFKRCQTATVNTSGQLIYLSLHSDGTKKMETVYIS